MQLGRGNSCTTLYSRFRGRLEEPLAGQTYSILMLCCRRGGQ